MRAPDSFSEEDLHYTAWLLSIVEAMHALLAITGSDARGRSCGREGAGAACVGVCGTCTQHQTTSPKECARPVRSTREWCCELVSEEGVLWPLILLCELSMVDEDRLRDELRETQQEVSTVRAESKRRAAGETVDPSLSFLSLSELLERAQLLTERNELFAHALAMYSSVRTKASRLLLFIVTALDATALRRLLDAANGEVLARLATLLRADTGEAVALTRACGGEAARRAVLFAELNQMAAERGAADVGAALAVDVRVREVRVGDVTAGGSGDIATSAGMTEWNRGGVSVPESDVMSPDSEFNPVSHQMPPLEEEKYIPEDDLPVPPPPPMPHVAPSHDDTPLLSSLASIDTSTPIASPAKTAQPIPVPLAMNGVSASPLGFSDMFTGPVSPRLAAVACSPTHVAQMATTDNRMVETLRSQRTAELSELPRGKVAQVASMFSAPTLTKSPHPFFAGKQG